MPRTPLAPTRCRNYTVPVPASTSTFGHNVPMHGEALTVTDFPSIIRPMYRQKANLRRWVASLGVLCAVVQLIAAAKCAAEESPLPSADYGISTIWRLGGIGGWDYLALEPSGARLFISRGDRVDVVATAGGRRTGAATPATAGRTR